jgi:hypothetical protein
MKQRRIKSQPIVLTIPACIAVVVGASSGICADDRVEPVFRAGAATANITPELGCEIVGGFDPYPARHIHDELHARALVLDDGSTQLVFVICDNVGIPREVYDAAKSRIHAATGLPPEHMLMAATHTHSGPAARGPSRLKYETELNEYQSFLVRRIGDAVQCALNNLEPAEIGFGRAVEPSQVFNRRWFLTDPEQLRNPFGGVDQVRMNPPRAAASLVRPAGPTDPEISFLSVRATDGRPIALLANYSLHYVGGVGPGHISADYFAMFAARIGELLGAEPSDDRAAFVGLLTNGTSGDCNNIDFQAKGESLPPYQKMRQVADLVAQRVFEAHQSVQFESWIPLAAAQTELTLATRRPTPELLQWARDIQARPEDAPKWLGTERHYAARVLSLENAPESVTIILQAFRVGEAGITAIPFETFAETGLAIKAESPLQPTFNIELANGSYGYLPTPQQHELGGYETWLGTNFVEVEASERIRRTLRDLLVQLHQ